MVSGDLKSTFEERILAKDACIGNFYNLDVVRHWWGHHQRGIRDYAPYLWALLMLECWCQRFLR
jgi:hypothetical protein